MPDPRSLAAWAEECLRQRHYLPATVDTVRFVLCEECARAYADAREAELRRSMQGWHEAELASVETERDALLAVYRGAKKMIDCLDAKGWQVARGHGMAFEDAVRETRNALATLPESGKEELT